VGDVEEMHVVDTLQRTLGNWRAEPIAEPELARPERSAVTADTGWVVPMMNKPQADVRLWIRLDRARLDPS
jgi:predicted Zn-dependent peptidase